MKSNGQPAQVSAAPSQGAVRARSLTAFVCANSARGGETPTSSLRRRPVVPAFAWPCATQEILVPCTGRLQPENLLKAFETGADAVCIVACQEDNCHHGEGSRRAQRRVDYVRGLLDDIGLGGDRLMLFHLPGSAREDMTLGVAGAPAAAAPRAADLAGRVQAICDSIAERLASLSPNPLCGTWAEAAEAAYEMEESDDSEE
jgi:coenzyme F420-reducing hydrogenase delta subunit